VARVGAPASARHVPAAGRPARVEHALPDLATPGWRWSALLAVVAALVLIRLSMLVGQDLNARGVPIVLPYPPLLAFWHPHTGVGTPLTVLCLLLGLLLQRRAPRLRWGHLLLAGWLLALAWMFSLVMIDGLDKGWLTVLTNPNEYLHDLPRITSPAEFLRTFSHYIAYGGDVDGTNGWTTHVAGHPPLATLVFWALARVGLGGGGWAGLLCILVSSAAAVGMPVVLRELGAPDAARRLVPFAALMPGAVWMAVSADGLFAGVAVGGLALACRGAGPAHPRARLGSSLAGGVLLGAAIYLSYGLVLFGFVVLAAVVVGARGVGLRAVLRPWLVSTAGVVLVAAAHFALGFNWFVGLARLRVRYYQQTASDRPYSYFVWANLAAWLVAWSPLLAYGVVRVVGVLLRSRRTGWTQDVVVAVIGAAGTAAALAADLSAMSKAETERIWLTFGAVAYAALALVRGRWLPAVALVLTAGWAVLVNSLLDTGW
jgi:methylthioxylose transferase